MSSSFLTRLYEMTGDSKYSDILLTQLAGYKKRLWMEDEKLFSHIYFPEEEKASRVPWGRGNGWVMVSLTEILIHCNDENLRSEALMLYKLFVDGVVKNQDECGMWHQVLNRPDSYIETSCSAMFALTIARGVNNGWLDKGYAKYAVKAWEGILKRAVDNNGDLYGVCLGSGCHMQAEYYFNIPTHKNDDHGTGIVLAAGCEIIRMIEKVKEDS
jgi:rhamnogalacturonyl hydrolase YesR